MTIQQLEANAEYQAARAAQRMRVEALSREFGHDEPFLLGAIIKFWTPERARTEFQAIAGVCEVKVSA